jgi:hypothetical protein
MVFMVLMIGAIQQNIGDRISQNRAAAVQEIANIVQSEISLAQSSSDGYRRDFDLPATLLNGVPYNAILISNLVYVYTTDNTTTTVAPVLNYSGHIVIGTTNHIQKVNGQVCLNTVC